MATWNPFARTAHAARRIATLLVVLALALQSPLHGLAHAAHLAGMPASSGTGAPAGVSLTIPGTDFVLPWCAPGAQSGHAAIEGQPGEAPAAPVPARSDPCIAHCIAALTAALAPSPAGLVPVRIAVRRTASPIAAIAFAIRPVVGEGAGPRAPPL